jgi:hypothetical protein
MNVLSHEVMCNFVATILVTETIIFLDLEFRGLIKTTRLLTHLKLKNTTALLKPASFVKSTDTNKSFEKKVLTNV